MIDSWCNRLRRTPRLNIIRSTLFFLLVLLGLHGQTIEEKRDALLLQKEEKELRTYLNEVKRSIAIAPLIDGGKV